MSPCLKCHVGRSVSLCQLISLRLAARSLGPVAPLALWLRMWPVHLPPTVQVWWEGVQRWTPWIRHRPPSPSLPHRPPASCSGPRTLPGGPQETWEQPSQQRLHMCFEEQSECTFSCCYNVMSIGLPTGGAVFLANCCLIHSGSQMTLVGWFDWGGGGWGVLAHLHFTFAGFSNTLS